MLALNWINLNQTLWQGIDTHDNEVALGGHRLKSFHSFVLLFERKSVELGTHF
jgi:hypothetical protein